MPYPYIEQNNRIGEELLQTCGCSKEILKVFPFQNEKELVDYEEELYGEKALFQIKNEISKKDSINTLPEKNKENLIENIIISNTYIIDNLKMALAKNGISNDITDKIDAEYITNKDIGKVSKLIKRQYQERNKNISNNNEISLGNKRGRKNQNDITKRFHDKNTPDNILKKCKRVFFDNIIIYTNSYINNNKSKNQENFELKKLNYSKYINKLNKEDEMKLFNMKLKDFVSLEINAKSSLKFDKNYNKIIMKKVLKEEKDNEVINSFLNMTFGEWVDVFTFKTKFNNNSYFNGIQDTLDKFSKEKNEYFTRFIFYLFNYKSVFENKIGRNLKKSKENRNTEMQMNKSD